MKPTAHRIQRCVRRAVVLVLAIWISIVGITPLVSSAHAGNASWHSTVGNPGISRTKEAQASKVLDSIEFEGDLVVGGFFGLAGDVTALHVARWDGVEWSSIGRGRGVSGRVNALGVFNAELYAGGTLDERVVRYDEGTDEWVDVFGLPDEDPYTVNAIATDDSHIYICGSSGTGVIQYDGITAIQLVDASYDLNVAVSAAIYQGQLVVGGTEGARLLAWNGVTWSPLAESDPLEPDKQVEALYVHNGILYAGGASGSDDEPEFDWIAAWNGVMWSEVGGAPLRHGLIGPLDQGVVVMELASYQDDLVVCGSFTMIGDTPVNHIARWTGTQWRPFGSGVGIKDQKRFPTTMTELNGSLFVGGAGFEVAGGKSAFRMAEWREDPSAVSIEWGGVDEARALVSGALIDSVAWDPALPIGEATYLPLERPDRAFDATEYASIRGDSLICRLNAAESGADGRISMALERRFQVRSAESGPISGTIPFRLTGDVGYLGDNSLTGGTYSIQINDEDATASAHTEVGMIDDFIGITFTNLLPDVEYRALIEFDVRAEAGAEGSVEYVMALPDTFRVAGFNPIPEMLTVDEGDTTSYAISIQTPPSSPVTISMAADPIQPITISDPVTFTAMNWTVPQTVTLTAADDFIDSVYPEVTVSHTITGAPEYEALSLPDISVSTSDNDDAGFIASETTIEVLEGDDGSYQVSLTSEPTAAVTVRPVSSETDELDIVGNDLVFVPESWFVPQTVNFRTVDDFIAGTRTVFILHTVSSSDDRYASLTVPDVEVTIIDDDIVAPLISLTALNVGSGVWLEWELPSPVDPGAVVSLRYAFDTFPNSPTAGMPVENGTGGLFSLAETIFMHVPGSTDRVYYSAFVSADAQSSPRVVADVTRVTLLVDQSSTNTQVRVSDVGGVDAVMARVRLGGEPNFSVDPLPFVSEGDEWVLSLPAALGESIRGIEFFVELTGPDVTETISVGSTERPERITNIVSGLPAPFQIADRYRMTSGPLDGVDGGGVVASMNASFGDESAQTWKVRRWNGSVYDRFDEETPPPFRPGEAYWVITAENGEWTMSGSTTWPAADGFHDVTLQPGWNMIGNPAGYTLSLDPTVLRVLDQGVDLPLSEVSPSVLSGNFYGPVETAPATTEQLVTLDPFDGMWVRNRTSDHRQLTLRLPAREVPSTGGRSLEYRAEENAWVGAIRMHADDGVRSVERVIEFNATDGQRSLENPPLSPSARSELALSPIEDDGSRFAVFATGDDERRSAVLDVWAAAPVVITTDSRMIGSASPHHFVLTSEQGRRWDMSQVATLELLAGRHRLTLEVVEGAEGDPSFPPGVVAARVVPNPVRSQAWVEIDTPTSGHVSIDVFDVAGRRIGHDVRPVLSAGRHAVAWETLQPSARVPNGLYWLMVTFRSSEDPGRARVYREKVVVLR